jgi:hypothetical protein
MSHFTFTRSTYDDCALNTKQKENDSAFGWTTDNSVVESKKSCYQGTSPFMHNPYRSIPMNSVDIESELRGQNLDLTKCPEKKFDPSKQKPVTVNLNDCDNTLVPVYTRLNNATNIFSGITINRFNPLHENLQTNIHQNSYIGVNTRLLLKDVFSSKK